MFTHKYIYMKIYINDVYVKKINFYDSHYNLLFIIE